MASTCCESPSKNSHSFSGLHVPALPAPRVFRHRPTTADGAMGQRSHLGHFYRRQLRRFDQRNVPPSNRSETQLIALKADNRHQWLLLIWCDSPYGTNYGAKTNWISKHGGEASSRHPIVNDSPAPDQLHKLFAIPLHLAAEHALPGASIYATVRCNLAEVFHPRTRGWASAITTIWSAPRALRGKDGERGVNLHASARSMKLCRSRIQVRRSTSLFSN
jgi:hypothetical protein